eukprot:11480087-Ditylum_brightwellii.AAC.2
MHQVLIPNENLVGKELTVEAAEQVVESRDLVICHAVKRETFLCHKMDKVDITKVMVAPHGKPSTLWVVCHDVGTYYCHVMNMNDMVFSVPSNGVAMSTELF